jgi:hypothetical protein
LRHDELRGERHGVLMAGRHDGGRQKGVEVLGGLAGTGAGRAGRAVDLGRAVVLGAIQRDQHARAQALEGREPARALQVTDHLVEHGKQVIGRDRVEHAADVAVTGDAAHPEQGVGVGAAVPGRKLALVGQKRGALGEEHRERGQAEVGHGVGGVVAPARVREALAAAPHGAD